MTNKQTKALILTFLSLVLLVVGNFYKFEGNVLCCEIGGFGFGWNIVDVLMK